MFTEKSPCFLCEKCHYKCSKKSEWDKHLQTLKHNNVYPCLLEKNIKKYTCECGKQYSCKQTIYTMLANQILDDGKYFISVFTSRIGN